MKFKGLLLAFLSVILMAVAVYAASPVAPIGSFTTKADGQIVYATDWNTSIGGIYTYINNTLLGALNVLTTKGDIYVFDGFSLNRLAVGSDTQLLTANSAASTGLSWGSVANVTNLTTKGDLLGYDTGLARIPVGTNGQVLTANSAIAAGVEYQTPSSVPKGTIIAWSPLAAGTSTIPTGWGLCDGTVHAGVQTPNLIGCYVMGTQPTGGGATPQAGGYGNQTVDAFTGTTTHGHGYSGNVSVGGFGIFQGSGFPTTVGAAGSYPYGGSTSVAGVTPACYALVYICKLT
jgi:hypothetical protein